MTFVSNPPAFYAEVVIKKVVNGEDVFTFNPIWLRWFVDLAKTLNGLQGTTFIFGDVIVNTLNKVTITQPAVGATLTLLDGKTLTINKTLILDGVDGKTLTVNDSTILANGGATFANAAILALAASKTFTVNKTLTLTGTDGTTMTFPATSASVARTDAAQSFTGLQTANVKVASAGGNQSSDGSAGLTGTLTTASLVGKTLTFKDGIITGFA